MARSGFFLDDFQLALRTLVNVHHSIYPRIPPQGIYFEALVEEAFKKVKKPFTPIKGAARNQPTHDLLVDDVRISLKTETGLGTKARQISITKLCTTEKEPWTAEALVPRMLAHLDHYDVVLMLRAIWELPVLHYPLLEIPIDLLRLIQSAKLGTVGRRTGRKSIGADVLRAEEKLFHVHFDGSDGKCQIRNLGIKHCEMLQQWDLEIGS